MNEDVYVPLVLAILGGFIYFAIQYPKTYHWIFSRVFKISIYLMLFIAMIYLGRCAEINSPSGSIEQLDEGMRIRFIYWLGFMIFISLPWLIEKIKSKEEKSEDKIGK